MWRWGSRLRRAFGRYQLIAHIGRGGMAEIFLARQRGAAGFERLVALKLLRDEVQDDPVFVTMFLDEVRLSAQLDHPNVVQVFDAGRVGRRYYMAMEYLLGESLAQVLAKAKRSERQLPAAVVAQVIMLVAEGLQHAHTRCDADGEPLGIVHRDVSPQNVFVRFDGVVKVLDFGVAKAAARLSETQTGGIKGKLGYLSPEHALGGDLDGQSDVFSLGVVLWECLTGRQLFNQQSPWQILERVVREDAPDPRELVPQLPASLAELCLKALARDRAQRFASAAELRDAIAVFLREAGQPPNNEGVAAIMRELFGDRGADKLRAFERADQANLELPDDRIVDLSDYITRTDAAAADRGELGRTVQLDTNQTAAVRQGPLVFAVLGLAVLFFAAALWILLLPSERSGEAEQQRPDAAALAAAPDGEEAGPSVTVQTTLDAGDVEDAAVRSGEPAGTQIERRGVQRRQGRPRGRARAGIKTPPPPRANEDRLVERGKLRLVTHPWAAIYHRGRKLGLSPLVDVPLPAGVVRLRAVNKAEGIDQTFTVEIKPGPGFTKHTIELSSGEH